MRKPGTALHFRSPMSQNPIDVLTLGNAIVDVLAQTDEAFLVAQNVHKGAMQLIDEQRAEQLYGAMGPATIVSGGSGANTAAGAIARVVMTVSLGCGTRPRSRRLLWEAECRRH